MQLQITSEYSDQGFTLTKRFLTEEDVNEEYQVTILLNDLKPLFKKTICQIKELPDTKKVYHYVHSPEAQKFFHTFHRYGPLLKQEEDFCPYQGGNLRKQYELLIGKQNIAYVDQEKGKDYKKIISTYRKNYSDNISSVVRNIVDEWFLKQSDEFHQPLFQLAHEMIGKCLIQGFLGYEECSDDDVSLNVNYWKTLFAPKKSELVPLHLQQSQIGKGLFDELENLRVSPIQSLTEWANLAKNVMTETVSISHAYYIQGRSIKDLVQRIFDATILKDHSFCFELRKNGLSTDEILEMILGILLAGQETTGYLFGFILYEYARSPYLQTRTLDDPLIKEKVFLEALRMYSPAQVLREIGQDMEFKYYESDLTLASYYLRKGDTLLCNYLASGYRDDLFKDPEEFDVDRENLLEVKKTTHFGSGPNRCIGEIMAKTQIFSLIDLILSKVKISTNVKLPELVLKFTLKPIHDIEVNFQKR